MDVATMQVMGGAPFGTGLRVRYAPGRPVVFARASRPYGRRFVVVGDVPFYVDPSLTADAPVAVPEDEDVVAPPPDSPIYAPFPGVPTTTTSPLVPSPAQKVGPKGSTSLPSAAVLRHGLVNVPGLSAMSDAFVDKVVAISNRRGWDPNGLDAVMSFETNARRYGSFSASIQNPTSTRATGLIQFTAPTAAKLGTTLDALARMTPEDQLDYVERFFANPGWMPKVPSSPEDYELVVLGRGNLVDGPDDAVVFPASSNPKSAYQLNKLFDTARKGYVDVGDVRRALRSILGQTGSVARESSSSGMGLGGGLVLGLGVGAALFMGLARRRAA